MAVAEAIPDERPLTSAERELTRWMLEHGGDPDAPEYLAQLNNARVVSRCPCGCASIDFEVPGFPAPSGGLRILGDFVFGADDHLCGAFVFERSGLLAGLEVYGLPGDAPSILPQPNDLRPFEAAEPAPRSETHRQKAAPSVPWWQRLADWDFLAQVAFLLALVAIGFVVLAVRACE